MKPARPSLLKRIIRGVLLALLLLVLAALGILAYAVWRPTSFVVAVVNWHAPDLQFSAESIHWLSLRSLQMDDARFGTVLRVPRSTLVWQWRRLWNRHIDEMRLERPEVYVDLAELEKIGGTPSVAKGGWGMPVPMPTWYLDRLVLERGGIVMVGLGEKIPPLELDVEGRFDDIPFGGDLSEEDRQKVRRITFSQLHLHSPLDAAVELVSVDELVLEFRMAGLLNRELDSLVFQHPTLNVDRAFFWYVEELRKVHAERASTPPPPGPVWRVKSFRIHSGQLDISRLREISLEYPFEFEASRENLNLRDLSLAQFKIEMDIKRQNIRWPALNLSFQNLRGKITPNLEGAAPQAVKEGPGYRPPNDLVNTLYVDRIRWKDFEALNGWVSLTFDPNAITIAYGGEFSGGYINGGATCGWSLDDEWRTWGAAVDVDTGAISDLMGSRAFSMNGRAGLSFDVQGQMQKLKGKLNLHSETPGTIEIGAMDHVLDRVRKDMEGLKREVAVAFVASLREYPYTLYDLELSYAKPDATLKFRSQGARGGRKLDLTWHGLQNGGDANWMNLDWSVKDFQ